MLGMEHYWGLLLEIWREACQHISIVEGVARMAPAITRRLPVQAILVRRLYPDRSVIETVAVAPTGIVASERARTDCAPEQLKRLMSWRKRNEVLHRSARSLGPAAALPLVPEGIVGDVLVGPLTGAANHLGALILVAKRKFDDEHARAMEALLAPFTAALENDARLRELTALREAAEADNRSLLTRLGRPAIADAIVGAESGLRLALQRADQAAPSDVPVLLLGETGSGKEVLARAIHQRSSRGNSPFIRVNCGAIPSELIDSELFGHERGSFTGATDTRRGWFEQADGGSLFLDEVGELPPAAQVRLLRILQDGAFKRVGGEKTLTVDVRIIAATHRDLNSMIADGAFREDLWYRLAVFPIRIPPLRERTEDIPELARHFAARAARRFGVALRELTAEDLDLLTSYSWPGNARELQSVMDRAVILGDGGRLEIATSLGISRKPQPGRTADAAPQARDSNGGFKSLDEAMKDYIEAALTRCRGRVGGEDGAATLLGINPHTLRGRMRKLGIVWRKFRRHRQTDAPEREAAGEP